MKKIIIVLLVFLLSLTSCSYTKNSKTEMTDPMSFANGITSTNTKDFKTEFSYLLVENSKAHEHYLGYFGEVINETTIPIKFTGDVKITIE